MQLNQENSQRQTQVQKLAPHLIQANTLLQCSTMELLQMVEQEQQENPALDRLDGTAEGGEAGCSLCPGGRIGACAHCPFSRDAHPLSSRAEADPDSGPSAADDHDLLAARGEDRPEDERMAACADSEMGGFGFDEGGSGEGDFDPLLLARTQATLAEQLLLYLRSTSSTPHEAYVAEYLVDCLDERGYLHVDVDEACAVLHVPCHLIMQGIERLQGCDPPGVGARDLRECLLIQMRQLRDEGDPKDFDPIALRLISEQWESLVQRRHVPLPRRLGVTPQQIEEAVRFIQTRLTPNPAGGFRIPWDHRQNGQSKAVRPDVLIRRGGVGFTIEVLGFDHSALQVNPHYRSLYETIRAGRQGGAAPRATAGDARLSPDHQKHVVAYVERASMFLKNLQQRRQTIQKITEALIECQQGFLETGQRAFLRPLTRTHLATRVGMHESTISRALLYKFVQLPTEEVAPFDIFFETAVTVKDTIAALIAEETFGLPLSDQAVVDALSARGMTVARRTVVKYREEMRIPASHVRRRG